MNITIGIVTRNRENSLVEMLGTLKRQQLIPKDIIVVENNKRKTLASIVKTFRRELDIKYFIEGSLGMANARNKVFEEAESDIVCFVDDDCLLPSNWTRKIIQKFTLDINLVSIVCPSKNYFRGSPIAEFEQALHEAWLNQYFDPAESSGLTSGIFVNTRNFCIRRSIVRKFKLAFSPNAPYKLEDTDFGMNLFSKTDLRKHKVLYNSDSFVYHKNSRGLLEFLVRRESLCRGEDFLRDKYPKIINVPKNNNKKALEDFGRRDGWAWMLFFVERQYKRILRFLRRGEVLLDVENNLSWKIW